MAIQRGLKATGTFFYQTAVCGRGAFYESYIEPTLKNSLAIGALARIGFLPPTQPADPD